jgi:hypothetical protein
MSNQIVRDHTRRLLVARYELERMQCKAISWHKNLPNQIQRGLCMIQRLGYLFFVMKRAGSFCFGLKPQNCKMS